MQIKSPIIQTQYSGKVRDIYDLGDNLLIVSSDRLSAFDVVFPDEIKDKGKILNKISSFFFQKTSYIVKNHFITDNIDEMPQELHKFKHVLHERSMLVKKAKPILIECIVRGYLAGSAWLEYENNKTINGIVYKNLVQSQKLDEPIFMPSTKSQNGHDENISFQAMCEIVDNAIANKIKNISIELYKFAYDFYLKNDIILADTKFEFGLLNNEIYLIDEIFTPDSSRLWCKNSYKTGCSPFSYDKQYIRDYVTEIGWDKSPPAPRLPVDIINKTIEKYMSVLDIMHP